MSEGAHLLAGIQAATAALNLYPYFRFGRGQMSDNCLMTVGREGIPYSFLPAHEPPLRIKQSGRPYFVYSIAVMVFLQFPLTVTINQG